MSLAVYWPLVHPDFQMLFRRYTQTRKARPDVKRFIQDWLSRATSTPSASKRGIAYVNDVHASNRANRKTVASNRLGGERRRQGIHCLNRDRFHRPIVHADELIWRKGASIYEVEHGGLDMRSERRDHVIGERPARALVQNANRRIKALRRERDNETPNRDRQREIENRINWVCRVTGEIAIKTPALRKRKLPRCWNMTGLTPAYDDRPLRPRKPRRLRLNHQQGALRTGCLHTLDRCLSFHLRHRSNSAWASILAAISAFAWARAGRTASR